MGYLEPAKRLSCRRPSSADKLVWKEISTILRITIGVAMKIRDRYGVTLDWIYAGDPHALPSDLYHQLVASAD